MMSEYPGSYPSSYFSPSARPLRQARRRHDLHPALAFLLAAGVGTGLLIVLFLAAFAAWFGYFQIFERILPGVQVGSTRLGGQSLSQGAIEIQRAWNLEKRITLSDGSHSLSLAPADLGIQVDPLATAQRAYSVGHNQPLLAELDQLLMSVRSGWGIAPVVVFDPQAARAGLEAIAPQLAQPPKDASLSLEGGQLVVQPSQIGYALNVEATLAALQADPLKVMLEEQAPLQVQPVQARITDVQAAQEEAHRILHTSARMIAYDAIRDEKVEWAPSPETLLTWLTITASPNGPQIGLDPARAVEDLNQWSASLGAGRYLDAQAAAPVVTQAILEGHGATLTIRHSPTTYTVVAGDTLLKVGWKVGMPYWRVLKANPNIDPEALVAGQQLVIPSQEDLLPLPIVENKRIIISISKQHMKVIENGEEIRQFVISTGIDRSPTQPGIFQIQTHEKRAYASVWDLYMPDFLGIYEAWPGFMNGIHGLPTLSNGVQLWANILGRPASYGCIILDLDASAWLYDWAENGVIVEIRP